MQTIIGVDIGGTLLRAALFDTQLSMLERAQQETRASEGIDAVLERLYETITQVLPEDMDSLLGIGIATPGPLDAKQGVVLQTPNLPFLETPLQGLVHERFRVPVYVGNDADLAGLAEYMMGAGQGASTLVYMTISTGVGGGIIIDNKPLIGGGLAGEIGHMVIDPHGPLCGCGHPGHLEAFSSGTGIARNARRRLEAGEPSMLRDMCGGQVERVTAREVGEAAQKGDALALEVVTEAGHYLGAAIASLMSLLNPDIFVLGGGVTKIGDLLFDPLHKAVQTYALHERYWRNTPIVLAKLGEDVGLVGGAALVHSHQRTDG